jgi:hypothetical protein
MKAIRHQTERKSHALVALFCGFGHRIVARKILIARRSGGIAALELVRGQRIEAKTAVDLGVACLKGFYWHRLMDSLNSEERDTPRSSVDQFIFAWL